MNDRDSKLIRARMLLIEDADVSTPLPGRLKDGVLTIEGMPQLSAAIGQRIEIRSDENTLFAYLISHVQFQTSGDGFGCTWRISLARTEI